MENPRENTKKTFKELKAFCKSKGLDEREAVYLLGLFVKGKEAGQRNRFSSVTLDELEEFFLQMSEDWQLWDVEQLGEYPVDRVFAAMKTFIEQKKVDQPTYSYADSKFYAAVKYVQEVYCDGGHSTPYMLIGDVATNDSTEIPLRERATAWFNKIKPITQFGCTVERLTQENLARLYFNTSYLKLTGYEIESIYKAEHIG